MGTDIDIRDLFAATTPARWHHALVLRPIERAQCFVIPQEEDLDKLVRAKNLVAEVIAGRTMNAGVRWKYSGTDWAKGAVFDLAADFYGGCYWAAIEILQAMDPAIAAVWPCVEFESTQKCCEACESLRGKRLTRRNAAVRTFYPPWHFGCRGYVNDSHGKASPDFTLSVKSRKLRYFHNPFDLLVSRGLCADFAGIDFGEHTDEVLNISDVGASPSEEGWAPT
jgi:hypothetical protein